MVDEAFVIPIAESGSKGVGLEIARSTVKDAAWNNWGWIAFENVWLAR